MTISKIMMSLVVTALLAGPSFAANQTIQGKSFTVKNPQAADPSKRSIVASGKEKGSSNTIVGDPTIVGATLTVIAQGADSSTQAFLLPQGSNVKGKPFWQTVKTGFKYNDGKGEQGPVKTVALTRTDSGNFVLKAVIAGKLGPVIVVPPDPGTAGWAVLEISGGDRYCMQFADGVFKNKADQLFKVTNPLTEGCPSSGSPMGAFVQ